MRVRFRASDFDQVAKINIIGAKSNQASRAEMMLGSFFFLVYWLDFGLKTFKTTSTTAATSGAAPIALRSALDSSTSKLTLIWA